MALCLHQCAVALSPAAVVPGAALQGAGSAGQAHAGESVVVRELRVRQAPHAVGLVEDVLPVGAHARRPLGEAPEQEGVQLVDDLLVDAGLELAGEEGGPRGLLQRQEEEREGEGERGREREKLKDRESW